MQKLNNIRHLIHITVYDRKVKFILKYHPTPWTPLFRPGSEMHWLQ